MASYRRGIGELTTTNPSRVLAVTAQGKGKHRARRSRHWRAAQPLDGRSDTDRVDEDTDETGHHLERAKRDVPSRPARNDQRKYTTDACHVSLSRQHLLGHLCRHMHSSEPLMTVTHFTMAHTTDCLRLI